ncbi:MAG TPA: OsmC family protein [Candidatus Sulfotelmatobacter sp.]|nr:OsmC family protein [Candidatus Sulfotelmatobacter sp.]
MTLREIQRPIKDRYVADPSAARITLRATGQTGDGALSCSVDIGRALYAAGAHQGVGGSGLAACSGDLLLGALAACAQLTCQMVAENMGLDVRIRVTVEGDLDLRGTLGTPDVPVGFEAIRIHFDLRPASPIEPDRLARLQDRTERYCVVLQTLLAAPAIDTQWREEAVA